MRSEFLSSTSTKSRIIHGNVEPVIQNIIPDLKEEWKIPTFPRSRPLALYALKGRFKTQPQFNHQFSSAYYWLSLKNYFMSYTSWRPLIIKKRPSMTFSPPALTFIGLFTVRILAPLYLLVPDGYIAKTRKQGKGMLEVPWLAVNPENDSLLHG